MKFNMNDVWVHRDHSNNNGGLQLLSTCQLIQDMYIIQNGTEKIEHLELWYSNTLY